MEKRMNKKGSGFLFYILILTALIIGFAVNSNHLFDVDKFKSQLNWTHVNITAVEQPDLSSALESLVNGIGEAVYSIMKWMAQWTSENPDIPYKLLIFLVLLAILAPIIYYLTLGIIILVILIKENIRRKKEKKELNRLRKK